jgi:filamentous hemagglutinin
LASGKTIPVGSTVTVDAAMDTMKVILPDGTSYVARYSTSVQKVLPAPEPVTSVWSSTGSKTAVENAYGHWTKHKIEFPEYQNSVQYVKGAQDFVSNPPLGTLAITRTNGDTVLYNPATNTFAVKDVNGAPKTMFRPDPSQHGYSTNLDYFNAQGK